MALLTWCIPAQRPTPGHAQRRAGSADAAQSVLRRYCWPADDTHLCPWVLGLSLKHTVQSTDTASRNTAQYTTSHTAAPAPREPTLSVRAKCACGQTTARPGKGVHRARTTLHLSLSCTCHVHVHTAPGTPRGTLLLRSCSDDSGGAVAVRRSTLQATVITGGARTRRRRRHSGEVRHTVQTRLHTALTTHTVRRDTRYPKGSPRH